MRALSDEGYLRDPDDAGESGVQLLQLLDVHPEPLQRYEALSEFVHDLRHPNADLLRRTPLMDRNPVLFWKTACAALGLLLFLSLLFTQFR